MTWLSIDGGNEAKADRACYVAEWLADRVVLCHAWSIEAARMRALAGVDYSFLCVERHQQDGRTTGSEQGGRVPPGVVIDLAWNTAGVAYLLSRGAPVHEYRVREWIEGTGKAELHQRIWAALSAEERQRVACFGRAVLGPRKRGPAESGRPADVVSQILANLKRQALGQPLLKHDWYNILDAVGVGLFHLGRVGKGAAPKRPAR